MPTSTFDTDDLHTFNVVPTDPTPEPDCKCMTHWGEFPLIFCSIDPQITVRNKAMLSA